MGILELLDQSEIWIDKEGNEHRVAEMEFRHVRNLIAWLERRAQTLANAETWSWVRMPWPDEDTMAYDMLSREMDRELDEIFGDELGWLRRTPLMIALKARAAQDDELTDFDL